MKQNYGVERISQEDYNYQTRYGTRAEMYKLVNSEAYQRAMKAKGGDSAKWNWQVYDRQEGFLPKDVEEDKDSQAADDVNMEEKFLRIDEAMRRERGGFLARAKTAAASSKSMYVDSGKLDDSLMKSIKSPSQFKRHIKTPSTTHTLRSSPHKTRSLLKAL